MAVLKTSEAPNTGDKVFETKRKIVFIDGTHLNLRNVTKVKVSGTWWRIWSDEGFVLVDPAKVLYAIIDGE